MPSSRSLSDLLGVSRFTIITALDQLIAEGYLRAVHGSGTFVEAIAKSPAAQRAVPYDTSAVLSKQARTLHWRASALTNSPVNYLHMSASPADLTQVTDLPSLWQFC